jgi:hypothetical protein
MSPPKIVAICGAKRSGKDVLANFLADQYGYTHIKISQKLKDACKILFDFTDEQLESNIKESKDPRWGISPRVCMQFLGTEVMQYKIQEILPNVGRKFWIQSLLTSINDNKKYVISDLRFVHEYEELKKLNTFVIRVDKESFDAISNDPHPSEQEYKELVPDYTVENDMVSNKMLTQIRSFFDHL